jgi:DNA repair protein RadC
MVRNHHIGASASTLRAPQPSQEDRVLTKRLVDAGQLLGITVIDHIILGDGSETYYSFADEQLL